MGSGRRCSCWELSELDLERSRHRSAVEENMRYQRKVQDLQDELTILHGTVADIEKRYTDLSCRHRKSAISLDEATSSADRYKGYSNDMSNENRKLQFNCDRLQKEVNSLKESLTTSKEEVSDEYRRRVAIESNLGRDLNETEQNYQEELRRANSMHEIDSHHMKQVRDISRLQSALSREKERHNFTKRNFRHVSLHRIGYQYHSPFEWPYYSYLP